MDTNQRLISTRNAAELLGVAAYTLKRSRCTGVLLGHRAPTYRKLGRMVRYDQKVIEDWVAQFELRSNTAA